ncbi:RNase P subunit p29-like protein [Paxillus ammoniavirescens]|nr:RNase P subunit p29-like protein [Paxillus ammoniavirescens]
MTGEHRLDVVDPYKPITVGKNQRLKLTTEAPFTPTYIQQALTLSSDPAGTYASRVKDRHVLLENPMRESRARKERAAKQARKHVEGDAKKLKALGRNAGEAKGLWKLEKNATKFNLFVPLHQLWMGYMSELLGLAAPDSLSPSLEGKMPSSSSMHAKLVKADLHGSLLTVRQSRNPCLVGLSGIVIHETENAFKIVTRKDQLKLVPKQNSIFALAIPFHSMLPSSSSEWEPAQAQQSPPEPLTVLDRSYIEFDLYGNQFCFRSADRSSRKFKSKETIEL